MDDFMLDDADDVTLSGDCFSSRRLEFGDRLCRLVDLYIILEYMQTDLNSYEVYVRLLRKKRVVVF
jgi:hypothetical protein